MTSTPIVDEAIHNAETTSLTVRHVANAAHEAISGNVTAAVNSTVSESALLYDSGTTRLITSS